MTGWEDAAAQPGAVPQPVTEAEATALPRLLTELSLSVWALAALSCADDAGLLEGLTQPQTPDALARRTGVPTALVGALLDVLLALQLTRRDGDLVVAEPALRAALTGPGRTLLRAELCSHLLQSSQLAESAAGGKLSPGWRHTDPRILQAQGTRSTTIAATCSDHVLPHLDGLDLTAPGAAFLDVGAGVAALTIEMCRRWPDLRAVGLEPWEPALTEARANVATAQLGDRISLRTGGIETLSEDSVFDLAHVPVLFIPTEQVQEGTRRVRSALRPGGWVLLQVPDATGAGLMPAVLRLWCVLWGGDASMTPGRAEQLLREAGYQQVRTAPPLPGPPVRYVVGRRAGGPTPVTTGQSI